MDEGKYSYDQRILFDGNCCHPITPAKISHVDEQKGLKIDERDQIFKIINKLGINMQYDISHFTED